MTISSRIAEILSDLSRDGQEIRNASRFLRSAREVDVLDNIVAKIAHGAKDITREDKVSIARAFDQFRISRAQDNVIDLAKQRREFMRAVGPDLGSDEARVAFRKSWSEGIREIENTKAAKPRHAAAAEAKAKGIEPPPPAKFAKFEADDKVKTTIGRELAQFKGERLYDMDAKEFRTEFKKFEQALDQHEMIARQSELGRAAYRSGQDVADALRNGKKVTQDEVNLLQRMHARRLETHIEDLKGPTKAPGDSPSQQGGMMSGARAESPATKAALADHEKFKQFAVDRLGAFGEANKLFEAGSSQVLVQKFSKLDEMMGGFSIKQMGNPGDAKIDSLGNLENPEVLFASMIPDAGITPKAAAINLVPTSKADPSTVNGKILSYYDNEGNPITPLITANQASPDEVNSVLQKLLAYKPGTETHIHPADWEKVRGAVYERRFQELSDRLSGGQRLDATAGTGAAGKDSGQSELDDFVTALRVTGRVDESNPAGVSGRSISEIIAASRNPSGKISESDIGAIRRSHTAARAAENNPTSNVVRDIVDTLKPTTKEVTEVQTEMAKLRTNVRAAGMLDTSPIDPAAAERTIEEISDALRNGEQVKAPELERYISKQIGDSLESSQQSLVAALQAGFNANKRMDTETIFTQLEKIRKDPDYPSRKIGLDAKMASPRDINNRLFTNEPISDGELNVLRSFYKRHFDAGSTPAESANNGGMGIKALQLAQSITDGIKDAKSVPAGSISRTTHYTTGVVIPSVRRTVMYTALPVAFAGAVGQAALDPEQPNFVGRAAINFIYPDGNKEAADFAEFTYGRMNANTEMARGYFKKYLGIDMPQNVAEGQAKALGDVNFYKDAIEKIRKNQFIKEPTTDLRQALLMYASAKATGVASASNAEVQTSLNANVDAEAGSATSAYAKAQAEALIEKPTEGDSSTLSAPVSTDVPDISRAFKDSAQFDSTLDSWTKQGMISLSETQLPQVKAAWASVAADGKMEENDRSAFTQKLESMGIPATQANIVVGLAMSPP